MKNDLGNDHKVVQLDQVRKLRGEVGSITAILKDTKRIALAIETRTCALCDTMKMCVNKTGLCAACYLNLSPIEKKVADKEAEHKKIQLLVTDDRWKKKEDE
ncbi:MAG: hypothetical protein JRJ77_02105 [Deltaproteobacteria bacterium]|nr:hypothetical protein [Deltaproteobacteria bacterium]MBW2339532.1 hypothetical protein [Deltaproteobacteria bacterium]